MSSSAFPIIYAICALFCSSLVSISASKNSTAPIYVRYVRRRPPWFPEDLYVEDVVEEFRTKSKPLMFGSSEIEIQQFLEKDQKLQEAEAALGIDVKTNSTTPVKGEKIGTLRQVKKPPILELKPTITVTVYKPSDSLEMRINEFVQPPEPCTTTMKVPYTKVITNSAEIDYYDTDEGWSHIPAFAGTTTTTTQKSVWKLFGTTTISPQTTTTTKTRWTPFEPTKSAITTSTSKTTSTTTTPRSFWVNFGQTRSTSSSTTTTEKPIESTVSPTTQRAYGIFNLFGKPTTPSTTTETPTTKTEVFEEPTTKEFVSSFPDSAEEDKTTTPEIGTLDNLGESIEEVTSIPTTEDSTESIIKSLDDDYVNGEVVNSIEEDHTETSLNTESTVTEGSEEVITTTKKTKLFGWFG